MYYNYSLHYWSLKYIFKTDPVKCDLRLSNTLDNPGEQSTIGKSQEQEARKH